MHYNALLETGEKILLMSKLYHVFERLEFVIVEKAHLNMPLSRVSNNTFSMRAVLTLLSVLKSAQYEANWS